MGSGPKPDEELANEMFGKNNRELAKVIMEGAPRKSKAAKDELVRRKGTGGAKREIENMAISGGAPPKSVLRRITGW